MRSSFQNPSNPRNGRSHFLPLTFTLIPRLSGSIFCTVRFRHISFLSFHITRDRASVPLLYLWLWRENRFPDEFGSHRLRPLVNWHLPSGKLEVAKLRLRLREAERAENVSGCRRERDWPHWRNRSITCQFQ